MNHSLVLSSVFLLLLCACGNKDVLLMSSEVPPEDAKRYLITPKPAAETAPEADDDDD